MLECEYAYICVFVCAEKGKRMRIFNVICAVFLCNNPILVCNSQ